MNKHAIVLKSAIKYNIHESIFTISNSNIVPTTSSHNNSRLSLQKKNVLNVLISFRSRGTSGISDFYKLCFSVSGNPRAKLELLAEIMSFFRENRSLPIFTQNIG